MRPRIARALVALLFTTTALISPAVASAAEDTFALPITGATSGSAPFDIAGSENKTASKGRIIEIPPFDFPEPEAVASCRGCHVAQLEGRFEPPPFTL